jgi:hypothetical protein
MNYQTTTTTQTGIHLYQSSTVSSIHLLLSYSLFTRISLSLSPHFRPTHDTLRQPDRRVVSAGTPGVSFPLSPYLPLSTPPKGPPTSVYSPLWPTPASSNACTSILKESCSDGCILCNVYFCEKIYCPKEEYCVTTVTVYLHKRVGYPCMITFSSWNLT